MNQMTNRILLLIIGLLFGIIIGGTVAWYFFGSSGRNIFIVNQRTEKEKQEEPKVQKKKAVDAVSIPIKDGEKDSTVFELKSEGEESISLFKTFELKDSLSTDYDKNAVTDLNTEEQIIVKKDELLFVRQTNLIDPDKKPDELKNDSVITNISGIREPATLTFVIEYWKSPINYKGYKMGKNKLILFGIPVSETPHIYIYQDNFYLKNNEKIYKLEKTTEFKPYEVVVDATLIHVFNK
jgi:hypothetical protein